MKDVIVIIGPTASGKTALSISLAKVLDTEIVSADSMQVYKFMDIGTAKSSNEEMGGIKHYLINEVTPDVEFSVARYQEMALNYIKDIVNRGKIPIITGGTGLYINSLIYNINFSETICNWKLRNELRIEAQQKGNKYLHEKLRKIDPDAAAKIHENDIKKVIRAIEVFEHTSKPISYHQEISRINPPEYNYRILGLKMERKKLYERINTRVDIMIEQGLIEEVKKLIEMGYDKYSIPMKGLGYKEILKYLKGEIAFEEALCLLKRNTRRYAKRQITWFKRYENVYWIEVDKYKNKSEILKNVLQYLELSSKI